MQHGEKCSTTMKAWLLPTEPVSGAVPLGLTARAFAPPAAVSVVSSGKSPRGWTFSIFFFALTGFASQLNSTDFDGTVYPSVQ